MHRGVDAAIPPSRLFDFSLFGSDSGRSSDSDDSSSDSGSSTAPSIERMDDDSSISSGNSSISSIDTIDRLIEQRFDASIFGQQPPTEIDVPFAFADPDGIDEEARLLLQRLRLLIKRKRRNGCLGGSC
jgi:hypothetical protein